MPSGPYLAFLAHPTFTEVYGGTKGRPIDWAGIYQLSPNYASCVGFAVSSKWGAAPLPEFSTRFPLPPHCSLLPCFLGGGICLRCCMCYYHGCICFLNTVGTNVYFYNYLHIAIQDAEKLSFHPLITLWKKKKITASMFVVHVIYYSLSDSFISSLIKNRLSKVN